MIQIQGVNSTKKPGRILFILSNMLLVLCKFLIILNRLVHSLMFLALSSQSSQWYQYSSMSFMKFYKFFRSSTQFFRA